MERAARYQKFFQLFFEAQTLSVARLVTYPWNYIATDKLLVTKKIEVLDLKPLWGFGIFMKRGKDAGVGAIVNAPKSDVDATNH